MESMPGIAVVGAAVVAILAIVAMLVIARVRRARLQKKIRLAITNAGNVKSRYNLRASPCLQEPQGILRFRFILDGDNLPEHTVPPAGRPAPSRPAAGDRPAVERPAARRAGGGMRQKAEGATQLSSALAGLLSLVGSLLPRSVGTPLQQKASQIRRVESRASYAQQVPAQMAWFKSSASAMVPGATSSQPAAAERPAEPPASGEEAGRPGTGAPAAPGEPGEVPGGGLDWVQTPYVQPGHTLDVELLVRSLLPTRNRAHAFQVISCSADQGAAPLVAVEHSIQLRGGFWARRFLPYVLVGLMAIVLWIVIYWLASAGVLG